MNEESFVRSVNEDQLLKHLHSLKISRISILNVNDTLTTENYFLYVKIIRKYKRINDSNVCKILVEENWRFINDKVKIYNQYFRIKLKGKFASATNLRNLHIGDMIAVQGFRLETGGLKNKIPLLNFTTWNHQPCCSLDEKTKGAKLWESIWYCTSLKNLTPRRFAYCFGVVIFVERFTAADGNRILRVMLTDESIGYDNYVSFTIKTQNEFQTFGKVNKHDVLRLFRVSINLHPDTKEPLGFARIGSGGFDWSVWTHGNNVRSRPRVCEPELQQVVRLQNWCNSWKRNVQDNRESIRKVVYGSYFNLVVQIIVVTLCEGVLVLRVWDGTKAFCHLYKSNFSDKAHVILSRCEFLESVSVLHAIDVFVHDEHIEVAKTLTAGCYVRLRNVHAFSMKSKSYTVKLTLHGGGLNYNRGIELLSDSSAASLISGRLRQNFLDNYPNRLLPVSL